MTVENQVTLIERDRPSELVVDREIYQRLTKLREEVMMEGNPRNFLDEEDLQNRYVDWLRGMNEFESYVLEREDLSNKEKIKYLHGINHCKHLTKSEYYQRALNGLRGTI